MAANSATESVSARRRGSIPARSSAARAPSIDEPAFQSVLRRCDRIATQIEEREVKILWIGHKIGEISV